MSNYKYQQDQPVKVNIWGPSRAERIYGFISGYSYSAEGERWIVRVRDLPIPGYNHYPFTHIAVQENQIENV